MAGDRPALARAITAVENESGEARAVYAAIRPHLGGAVVVGITGPPGAGKSTLTGAYIGELRRRGKTVGVIAIDPSSPLSGGALLGDRIRMTDHAADPAVFVRSLAARGQLGGLSRTAARVVDVMDAAGKDVVIVETVGTGQSEVEIAGLADVKVVVCVPGLGDDVQAIKAGVLEIADILVLNKADQPSAEHAARQLERIVDGGAGRDGGTPVIRTVATTGDGIAKLADAIDDTASASASNRTGPRPRLRARRLIAQNAADHVRGALDTLDDDRLDAICEALLRGEIDAATATARSLDLLRENAD
jgi:LAO/AO transport system kinase